MRNSNPAVDRAVSKETDIGSVNISNVLKKIWGYIEATGQLSSDQPTGTQSESPTHRALIIASQYYTHRPGVPPLKGTLRDVILVYEMLTDPEKGLGYKPTDIRILVERLDKKVIPTRKNILDHLKWLTDDARSHDSRFLYFSGHGTYICSNENGGKQTVYIPKLISREPGDQELDPANTERYRRIDSITVPADAVVYYNEAIVASYSEDTASEDINDYFIYDHELNKSMSALPRGCKLTTLVDACHSGRILNCNYKLDGAGWRAVWHGETSDASEDPADANKLIEAIRTSAKYTFRPAFTSAPLVSLSQSLPENEKLLDKIQADVLTWSGCHQRQTSALRATSVFTAAFTDTVKVADKSWTIQQVFDGLNQAIQTSLGRSLQYAQVWTSLVQDSEEQAAKKLNENFHNFSGCPN